MDRRHRILLTATLAATGVAAAAGGAQAQSCSTLPNVVVVSGSTAVRSLVQRVAPALARASGADQMTVVYKGTGSCAGVTALAADAAPTGACATGACVTGTANYWDAAGTMQSCNLDPAGSHIDVALSDVFPASCAGVDTSHLRATQTVVIPFAFIAPHASAQVAIDTREAYLAYGFGMAGQVTPWNNEAFLFRRDALSGTQITIAKAIHVPENRFLGVDTMGTGGMLSRVGMSTSADATLGFAGTDAIDAARSAVTILAYRHWAQNEYFWPDSRHDTFDKRNVRDGHYSLWGYEQAVVLTGAGGSPVSVRGQRLADLLSGGAAVSGIDVTQLTIQSNLVPLCAMEVSRATDGGDFAVYDAPEPCGCYFDASVPMGATSCRTCANDGACGAGGHCRHGYCEAR